MSEKFHHRDLMESKNAKELAKMILAFFVPMKIQISFQ